MTRTKGPTIVIDGDDDDLFISSPRSFAQAKSSGASSRHRSGSAELPGLGQSQSTDDLLELRLGPPRVVSRPSGKKRTPARQPHVPQIDLTTPASSFDADCILVNEFVQKKRKPAKVLTPEIPKEVKLTCAICMDAMKEETSTICGHIFCKKCINGAIVAQKRCPTCRKALSMTNTHRIYLSGSLR